LASLELHKADAKKWLLEDFESVHKWLDEFFSSEGPKHRRFRHHREGVDEARRLFGYEGSLAAQIHILRDCRNIPRAAEYETGDVDLLGLRREWPITAYSQFSEEAFRTLVEHTLNGPTGILLWGFIGQEVAPLLPNLTQWSPGEVQLKLSEWEQAVAHKNSLEALAETPEISHAIPEPVREYFEAMLARNIFSQMSQQFGSVELAYLPVRSLITPLALIDHEYLDTIRPELSGETALSYAKFALPENINIPAKAAVSPDNRSVLLVSRQKSLVVSGMSVQQTPIGLEVRFLLTSGAAVVTVSRVGNRYYLKNGIHRVYVLASLGLTEIPCVLIRESQYSQTLSAYPAFSPSSLMQARPPLLCDFLDGKLSVTVPLQRTSKVIRIAAEDMIVPTD